MPVSRIFRRSAEPAVGETPEWDLEVRPRHAVRTARIVAVLIAAAFLAGGIWLRTGSTGVNFRVADQIAMVVIGLLIAGAVLMLTRPRVRVGPAGVSVRNVLGDSDFPWNTVVGVTFPDRKSWARLELVNDDYVPLLAIRSNDKAYAAESMDKLRALGAKYTAAQHPEAK
ncbi:PH domain-containing protein [Nocardia altamirensis]|uniref:PH domain-containing protein n=1 Tax=Nocardia altamirensis TaxID=472158 RepID=UPI00084065DA|nr:PH domain-containing protein [Nocardia altamirensis]